MPDKKPRSLAVLTVIALSVSVLALTPMPTASAAPGPLSGTTFRDFNANGAKDTTTVPPAAVDVGLAGVPVTAFDPDGFQVGSAVSGATGAWSITPSGDGPYRIEFGAPPAGMKPTSAGTAGKNTTVQFAPAAGGSGLDLGLNTPRDYCQDNPDLVTNCYDFGPSANNSDPVVISFPYNAGTVPTDFNYANYDNPLTHDLALTASEVGSTWGLAYERSARQLYTAAFMKRHTAFGPAGTGAIYRTDRASKATTVYADLNAIFGANTAGPNTHNPADYNRDNGNTSWDAVGKTAFGGMVVDDDETTLYAMNLADRSLYALPLGETPTVANIKKQQVPLNLPGCPSPDDAQPWAVQFHEGKLYIGIVCSAESTQAKTDLEAYIYTADPSTLAFSAAPVFSAPLTGPRGGVLGASSGLWNPWTPTFKVIPGGNGSYPQPILSDIVFDNGNLILGVRDRSADQFGNNTFDDPASFVSYIGTSGGDTLRACGSTSAGWTLEKNAQCGGITTAGANNFQGEGNGEYYYLDNLGGTHSELSLGGLVQLPGFTDMASTMFDPIQDSGFVLDAGTRRFDNKTGKITRSYRVFDGDLTQNTFGKANGLGDLIALCDAAPLEIGNRLWNDADGDGLQDAGESPLPGVTVELWKNGVKVGTAITDANGQYRFSSTLKNDPNLSDALGGGLEPNADFEIRVPNASGASQQGALGSRGLTTSAAGSNPAIDSDAVLDGTTAVIKFTTGGPGANNHTYDIGFGIPPINIGNQVWFDANNDGIRQGAEGVSPGVTVELFLDINGDGVLTGVEQTPVAVQTTDANGLYIFTERTNAAGVGSGTALTAGKYLVGIAASNFAAAGPLNGYFSSGAAADVNGNINDTIGGAPPAGVDGDDQGMAQTAGFYSGGVLSKAFAIKDGASPTGENPNNGSATVPDLNSDLTIDFGFYTMTLGDAVFGDNGPSTDNNGIQDGLENGIEGVPVKLYAADGSTLLASTVTDATGKYSFAGLAAGDYLIKITAPTGYSSSNDLVSTADPDSNVDSDDNGIGSAAGAITSGLVSLIPGEAGTNSKNVVDLATGKTTDPTVDFGLIPSASLGDFVWLDSNRNGIQDPGESGLAGVTVTLYAADGLTAITKDAFGKPIAPIVTAADGNYEFTNLTPGEYVLKFTPADGYLPTKTGAGTSGTDSNGLSVTADPLEAGEVDDTLDSGFYPPPGSIGNFVWADRDGDGLQDAGEPGLAGVTVTLYAPDGVTPITQDADGNPIAPITTGADGSYLFSNLPPGNYVVKFVPPTGWDPTVTGLDSKGVRVPVALGAGKSELTIDSGFIRPVVSVGDFVWLDADHDGVQDPTELGLAGAKVALFQADGSTPVTVDAFGQPVAVITTTADGKYTFGDLLPGQYVVKFTPPAGYQPTLTGQGSGSTDSSGLRATSAQLTGGQFDQTLDSGFWIPGVSVGDFIWQDLNRNGRQDSGELGLAGVTATLYQADGTTKVTTNMFGQTLAPAITGADGTYLFADLPPGTYVVKFAPPADWVPTKIGAGTAATDSNGTTATSANLPSGGSDLTLDSGFYPPAGSIGNFVWFDKNGDGKAGAGESGLAAVVVTLYASDGVTPITADADGAPIAPVTTGPDGGYLFSNLPAGSYVVKFAPPTGWETTIPGLDSRGLSVPVTISSGQSDLTVDSGFIKPVVSLGDFAWLDADHDGIQDPTESGLAGVTVSLFAADGTTAVTQDSFGQPIGSISTTADGKYLFKDLPPGQYVVKFTPPVGYAATLTAQGGGATDSNGLTATSSTLTAGKADLTLDSGFWIPGVSIGDFVWLDSDRDGVQDAGETGLAGVAVSLFQADGTTAVTTDGTGALIGPVTTGANGAYEFANLTPGQYVVKFTPPTGYLPTVVGAATGTPGTDSDGLSATSKVLSSGQSDSTLDSGFYPPSGSIGDFVWVDSNGDGRANAGETGLAGVTVTLYAANGTTPITTDASGNPITAITTAANGSYLFDNLPAGNYVVKFAPPAGWQPTATGLDSRGLTAAVNLGAGQSVLTIDSGFLKPVVSVGDFVWFDSDHDGIQDATEPGLAGVGVALFAADGSTPVTTDTFGNSVAPLTTTSAGTYLFADLAPGQYVVKFTAPAGYSPTLTAAGTGATDSNGLTATSSNLAGGQFDKTLDSGFWIPGVSVGDFVWSDADRDGVQDSGEPGLAGVTVTLLRADGTTAVTTNMFGQPLAPITTGVDGKYEFTDLPAGKYVVKFTAPDGWLPTKSGAGTPATDSNGLTASSAVLSPGQSDNTLDVGFVAPPGSIGNIAWFDRDGSGTLDSGEIGLEGVIVTLCAADGITPITKDADGQPITPITTAADGAYLFNNLVPGNYVVKFTPPAGWEPTITGLDSKGLKVPVTLPPGKSVLNINSGFNRPTVTVGDFVWLDQDYDGIQDPGEPGLAEVTVSLFAADGSTAITEDAFGNSVGPLVTGDDGLYSFDNMPPGKYVVKFTAPAPYEPTLTGKGTGEQDSNGPTATSANLTAGNSDKTLDAGFWVPGVGVGGFVWNDSNRNGIQDPGEPGLPGVTVTIYQQVINLASARSVRLAKAAVADTLVPVTEDTIGTAINPITTDADGFYEFPNLDPGEYVVKFEAPDGFVPTLVGAAGSTEENDSNGPQAVVGLLASGEVTTAIDAGFYPPAAAIGDFVWADLDGDGRAETGEQGLAGVKVELFAADGTTAITQDASGKSLAPITTGSSGTYLFDNLAAGTYTVKMTPPSGWEPTASGLDSKGASFPVTITAGTANLLADAGFLKPVVQLGDFVWLDADHDGVQDSAESGLAGVKVQLYAANGTDLVVADTYGTAIAPLVTAADGKYSFKNLSPGQYVVKFAPPAGYEPTLTGQGTGSTDSNGMEARPAALTAGQVDTTQDSGFWQPGVSIGDFVWSDENANGVQDASEPGLAAVKVQLFAADGSTPITTNMFGEPVAPISTRVDGKYTFAELRPGQYVVKFTPPAGYLATKIGAGSSSTDSNGLIGTTGVLGSGQSDNGIDSGFVAYGSVGDLVWLDDNGDGVRSASETTGVSGVKVSLLAEDGKTVANTTTNTSGNYEFTEVAPANYRLKFTPPSELIFTAPARGADRAADSDPDAQTGITPQFTVAPGQQVTALDAGLSEGSVISGVVFEDENNNGRQDPAEPGLADVVMILTGTDRFGNPVKRQAVTDAEGRYRFVVQPGTYSLSQIQPEDFNDGKELPGTAGGDAIADKIMDITVGIGENADGYTFGERELTQPAAPKPPAPPAPVDPPSALPKTGADAFGLVGLAAGLLLLGLALVRRRRAGYSGHRRG